MSKWVKFSEEWYIHYEILSDLINELSCICTYIRLGHKCDIYRVVPASVLHFCKSQRTVWKACISPWHLTNAKAYSLIWLIMLLSVEPWRRVCPIMRPGRSSCCRVAWGRSVCFHLKWCSALLVTGVMKSLCKIHNVFEISSKCIPEVSPCPDPE